MLLNAPANQQFQHEDCMLALSCLQILPFAACFVAVICGLMLIYGIGSPHGTQVFNTTPQGACIILSAAGSAACILMCFAVPHMSRRLRIRGHAPVAVKRMNYLGLVRHSACLHTALPPCLLVMPTGFQGIIGQLGNALSVTGM